MVALVFSVPSSCLAALASVVAKCRVDPCLTPLIAVFGLCHHRVAGKALPGFLERTSCRLSVAVTRPVWLHRSLATPRQERTVVTEPPTSHLRRPWETVKPALRLTSLLHFLITVFQDIHKRAPPRKNNCDDRQCGHRSRQFSLTT